MASASVKRRRPSARPGGRRKQWAPTGAVLTVNLNWKSVIEELMGQATNGLKEPTTYDLTYGTRASGTRLPGEPGGQRE